MWVGRGGEIDDGAVELTLIPRRSMARALIESPRLYDGRVSELPGVICRQVVDVQSFLVDGSLVAVDLDGEQSGILPLRACVIPKAQLTRSLWGGPG
jgi:diacylglycerol kinase family enzyme